MIKRGKKEISMRHVLLFGVITFALTLYLGLSGSLSPIAHTYHKWGSTTIQTSEHGAHSVDNGILATPRGNTHIDDGMLTRRADPSVDRGIEIDPNEIPLLLNN